MIHITVNGQRHELPKARTVTEMLEHLGLAGRPLLVELNRHALLKSEWDSTRITDGDVIELVQVVAGG